MVQNAGDVRGIEREREKDWNYYYYFRVFIGMCSA